MRKGILLLTGLFLLNVSAFAQSDGPVEYADDPHVVFMQDFESSWESWTSTPANTITQIEYYNREGSDNLSTANIYNGSEDWMIYGVRDTIVNVYNGARMSGIPSDDTVFVRDYYYVDTDRSAERQEAFARYGEDGGSKVFKYHSDNGKGAYMYNSGLVPRYSRNLFVHGIPIEENTSYRLTMFVKARQLGSVNPVLYADVMRGVDHSEAPFVVDLDGAKTSNWWGGTTVSLQAFEFEKNDFKYDQWEKVTFMTYYTNDSILNGSMYRNGYYWASGDWTWNESGVEHNYIKQPDNFQVRLSFASDFTDFEIDNLSLTKSTIGGVYYFQDKLRVDFGYQTNLADIVRDEYEKSHIAAVQVPGNCFEVWALWHEDLEDPNSPVFWEEIPILSGEYHEDGYMYMWTKPWDDGELRNLEGADKVLVSFRNPVDDPDLRLVYSSTFYPNSLDEDWKASGKPVLDFHNEVAMHNSYVFDSVYSMTNMPPVMQRPPYEDGSFGLDGSISYLSFGFSKRLEYDNTGESSNLAYLRVTKSGFKEIWMVYACSDTSVTFVRSEADITAHGILNGDYQFEIVNIKGAGTDYGENVVLRYNFGEIDTNPQGGSIIASDWRNEVDSTSLLSKGRPIPPSLYLHSGTDPFQKGTGYGAGTKCGLYPIGNSDDCAFYISGRKAGFTGNLYTIETLSAGDYSIRFKAVGWGTTTLTNSLYLYAKPDSALLDGNEYGFAVLESVVGKTLLGSFSPDVSVTDFTVNSEWPENTMIYEFSFTVPVSGDYVLEWVSPGSTTSYYGVVISNYMILSFDDLSTKYVLDLNESVVSAQEIVNVAESNVRYGGDAMSNLKYLIRYYGPNGSFSSSSPSDWINAKNTVDAACSALQSRMSLVDSLDAKFAEVADVIDAYSQYEGLSALSNLETLYNRYINADVSTMQSAALREILGLFDDAIMALDTRVALNNQLIEQIIRGDQLYVVAEYASYDEYVVMADALSVAKAFDYISAQDDEVIEVTALLKGAINGYVFRYEGVQAKTVRIKALADLADELDAQFTDDYMYYYEAYSTEEDNDTLADIFKAAIKVAIYDKIVKGGSVDYLDLTPFIKNYNLYATVDSVADKTRYELPSALNNAALKGENNPGYSIMNVLYQWGKEALDRKVWLLLYDKEMTDVFPGWSVTSYTEKSGSCYGLVIPDDEYYTHLSQGVPVYDGMLSLDWYSRAQINTVVEGLPAGMYSLGVTLPTLDAKTSSTWGSSTVSPTMLTVSSSISSGAALVETDGGRILTVDSVAVSDGSMSIDLSIQSNDGKSSADNFFLYYEPLSWYDYETGLADARAELSRLLGDETEPVIPDTIVVDSALAVAQQRLNGSIELAIGRLKEARDTIYRGQDYNNLTGYLDVCMDYDGDVANVYWSMADTLDQYITNMGNRIKCVDHYCGYLSIASHDLWYYQGYSYVAEYKNLSSLYSSLSALICPELTSLEIYSYGDSLYNAIQNLSQRVGQLSDNAKEVLRNAIDSASTVLNSAKDSIYWGMDYIILDECISYAKYYQDSDSALLIYRIVDSLNWTRNNMTVRMELVDEFIGIMDDATGMLDEYKEYSTLAAYQQLQSVYYDVFVNLSIPVLSSGEIRNYGAALNSAIRSLENSIENIEIDPQIPDTINDGTYEMFIKYYEFDYYSGDTVRIPVVLNNEGDITAFSLQFGMPSGFKFIGAELNYERAASHQLTINEVVTQDGSIVNVGCVSFQNKNFAGNYGTIMTFKMLAPDIEGEYPIWIDSIDMAASATRSYTCERDESTIVIEETYEPGDVNMDGKISIADAVGVVSFIINSDIDGLNRHAADANGDLKIDVADAVWVVNRVVRKYNAPMRNYVARELTSTLSVDDAAVAPNISMPIRLEGMINEVTAIQFNMTLPQGVSMTGIRTDNNHAVLSNRQDDGSYTVVCISLDNSSFSGNGEAAMVLDLTSGSQFEGGVVSIDNAKLVSPDLRSKSLGEVKALLSNDGLTRIWDIESDDESSLYDMQGRSISQPDGMYIRGGIKQIELK